MKLGMIGLRTLLSGIPEQIEPVFRNWRRWRPVGWQGGHIALLADGWDAARRIK